MGYTYVPTSGDAVVFEAKNREDAIAYCEKHLLDSAAALYETDRWVEVCYWE